jgi:hypothetical protein
MNRPVMTEGSRAPRLLKHSEGGSRLSTDRSTWRSVAVDAGKFGFGGGHKEEIGRRRFRGGCVCREMSRWLSEGKPW